MRSGAIATANRALDLGVTVGAVPGPIDSHASAGPNELIKTGAQVITSGEDLLFSVIGEIRSSPAELASENLPHDVVRALAAVHPAARRVWEALPTSGAKTSKTVAQLCGLSVSEVDIGLIELQLSNLVRRNERGWMRISR